jgi:hypothetical protein
MGLIGSDQPEDSADHQPESSRYDKKQSREPNRSIDLTQLGTHSSDLTSGLGLKSVAHYSELKNRDVAGMPWKLGTNRKCQATKQTDQVTTITVRMVNITYLAAPYAATVNSIASSIGIRTVPASALIIS